MDRKTLVESRVNLTHCAASLAGNMGQDGGVAGDNAEPDHDF